MTESKPLPPSQQVSSGTRYSSCEPSLVNTISTILAGVKIILDVALKKCRIEKMATTHQLGGTMNDEANMKLKGKIVEKFGTQTRFARSFGIQESFVSKVIHGLIELGVDQKRMWAKALGTKANKIF